MSTAHPIQIAMTYRSARARWLRTGATALLAASLSAQLAACFPLAVAGVAGASYAATDRRTLGAQTDDKVIAVKAENRISSELSDRAHVNVNSFNRKILLTGEVPDEASKAKAERLANGVESVTSVFNDLEVAGQTSLASRSNDAYITTKVKTQLVDSKDIFANAFKVVTERGVVYLMGRVTQREGDRAAEITRSVGGVQKVVKVFDYITEEELKQFQNQPAPDDKTAPARSS